MDWRRTIPAAAATILVLVACKGKEQESRAKGTGRPTSSGAASEGAKAWLIGAEQGARPSLMVANFDTESDDDLPWGSFFSRLAWEKLNYAPHEMFSMPIYGRVWEEFRHINHKDRGLRETQVFGGNDADKLARMFGLSYLVRGKVVKSGSRLEISATVRNIRSDKDLDDIRLEGSVDKPQELLTPFCMAVIEAVGVKPSEDERAYLARTDPASGDLFRRALALWADPPTSVAVVAESWRGLYAEDPGFTLARVYGVNFLGAVSREEGLAEVKRLLSLEPRQGRLGILRLGQLRFAGRYGDILREAPAFLRENPNDLSALNMLAEAYSQGNMHEQATAVVDRMLEINPHSWEVRHRAAAVVNAHAWHLRGTDYWAKVPESAKRVFPGLMKRCLREERTAATLNPNNPDVLAMVGGMLTTVGGSPEEAEDWCRRAIEIQSDHWLAHQNLVRLYKPGWTAQHDKAIAVCREAAAKNPESAWMQWLMADYLLWYISDNLSQTGRSEEQFLKDPEIRDAIETSMEKAIALSPGATGWRERAGGYYRKLKDWKSAWRHYSEIKTLPPRFQRNPSAEHEFWRDVALTALEVEQWEKALESAKTGLSKRPCRVCREWLLGAVAWASENLKDYDTALNHYELVLRENRKLLSWAYHSYAHLVLKQRPELVEKGYDYAQRAIQAKDHEADAHVVMARYYLKRNEIEQAREQMGAALKLDPDSKAAKELKDEHPNVPWDK